MAKRVRGGDEAAIVEMHFKEAPKGVKKWGGTKEVVTIRYSKFFLRLVYLPCGRGNCTKCPHGPYWYFGYCHQRKVRQIYLGKTLLGEKALRHPEILEVVGEVQRQMGVPVLAKEAAALYRDETGKRESDGSDRGGGRYRSAEVVGNAAGAAGGARN